MRSARASRRVGRTRTCSCRIGVRAIRGHVPRLRPRPEVTSIHGRLAEPACLHPPWQRDRAVARNRCPSAVRLEARDATRSRLRSVVGLGMPLHASRKDTRHRGRHSFSAEGCREQPQPGRTWRSVGSTPIGLARGDMWVSASTGTAPDIRPTMSPTSRIHTRSTRIRSRHPSTMGLPLR